MMPTWHMLQLMMVDVDAGDEDDDHEDNDEFKTNDVYEGETRVTD